MARNRFPTPYVERLPLSDGDWIEVKRDLTVGEEKDISLLAMRELSQQDGTVRFSMDYQLLPFAKAVVYVIAWSFHNAKGPVKLEEDQRKRLSQLRALDTETWDEIDAALSRHEEAVDAKKKSSTGTSVTETSSSSAAP
jgi:hypothetical protein